MNDALRPTEADALAAWAARVSGNRNQAERLREAPESKDFYAPVAASFKADPHRTNEPALDALRALAQPGDTWLDIGAGGGRYALPMALRTKEVIAVEPSDGMLGVLREGMAENDIQNVRIIQSRWPAESMPEADVCLISHIGYDIEQIGPFLDAMERSARRLCVAVLLGSSPASVAESFWPPVHGEARVRLPALPEFLSLQIARGRLCEVRLFERAPLRYHSREQIGAYLRQQLFIEPGGQKDRKLQDILPTHTVEVDGNFAVSTEPAPLGVVTWTPR
ncbi:MAG: methyltransferase domain-containing protein [Tepidiformaceae bacterium]